MHFTGLPLTLVSLLLSLQHTTALPLDRQERALSDSALDRTAKGVAWDDQGFAPPVELIAYYPVVTMPNASSVYQQGGMMTVSWNGTLPPYDPAQIPQTARILLGYLSESSPGFHLDIDNPLGEANLYAPPFSVDVTLPTGIPTRSSYLIILGSSGNTSPLFTIEGTGPPPEEESTQTTDTSRQIQPRPLTYVVGGSTIVYANGAPTVNLPGTFTPVTTTAATETATTVPSSPTDAATPAPEPAAPTADAEEPSASPSPSGGLAAEQQGNSTAPAAAAPTSGAGASSTSSLMHWATVAMASCVGAVLAM